MHHSKQDVFPVHSAKSTDYLSKTLARSVFKDALVVYRGAVTFGEGEEALFQLMQSLVLCFLPIGGHSRSSFISRPRSHEMSHPSPSHSRVGAANASPS